MRNKYVCEGMGEVDDRKQNFNPIDIIKWMTGGDPIWMELFA